MLLAMALCSAGLAASIALLNLGGRAVMELGGFVATGGPYVIAHPAPDWAGIMPLAVVAMLVFGGWSAYLSHRTGGSSLLGLAWAGLFISLGCQFGLMALDPPGQESIAWGWMVCAILFVPMGLAGLLVRPGGRARSGAVHGLLWYGERPRPCDDNSYRAAYTLLVVAGAVAGLAAALASFARMEA